MNQSKLAKDIRKEDFFIALLEEFQATLVETVFISNRVKIEGFHQAGKILIDSREDFAKHGIESLSDVVSLVSKSLGKSRRTIYRAIQFATKYPDLDKAPISKDKSLHWVCNVLLPEHKVDKKKCKHDNKIKITIIKCADCGLVIDKQKT